MDRETFGNFIANRRRDLGMTQQALADQLHVTDKAVSKWERGLCYPDLTVLENLAAALDLTVAELMACEKHPEEAVPEKGMSSLLEIANEFRHRQKKRVCLFVCVLALASILVAGLIVHFAAANINDSGYVTFVGKKQNVDGNFVYVETEGGLLCLRCPEQQLYDTIEADKNQVYHIEYRWNCITYRGTLGSCQPEDTDRLGTPMDTLGSAIGIGSLLGIDCAVKAIENVYPDPDRKGKYLYTFRYYYEEDGTDYFFGEDLLQTHILTVENCRSTVSADYDGDGIAELFVLTKYEEEPYMLYELEDGVIVSYFVDEVPADVLEWLKNGST